jgi:hypothetical protein
MEQHMPEPTAPVGEGASSATEEDRQIRQRVRELTSEVLQHGRVDSQAVRDVVRAMTGQSAGGPSDPSGPEGPAARERFADAVRALDAVLLQSANATHAALQQLAARGADYTDNDLKDALVALRELQDAYVAAAARVAEAMSGNLRQEMTELAARAQGLGAEASARVAGLMGEFATRMNETASSGLETVRGASMRMALLASGVLAGIADALRERSGPKKDA